MTTDEELGKLSLEAWETVTRLAQVAAEVGAHDNVPPEVLSKERLTKLYNLLSNAADQLSSALRRLDHPEHYAKCLNCFDKGLSPMCPSCLNPPKEDAS